MVFRRWKGAGKHPAANGQVKMPLLVTPTHKKSKNWEEAGGDVPCAKLSLTQVIASSKWGVLAHRYQLLRKHNWTHPGSSHFLDQPRADWGQLSNSDHSFLPSSISWSNPWRNSAVSEEGQRDALSSFCNVSAVKKKEKFQQWKRKRLFSHCPRPTYLYLYFNL